MKCLLLCTMYLAITIADDNVIGQMILNIYSVCDLKYQIRNKRLKLTYNDKQNCTPMTLLPFLPSSNLANL
jgi:hypothetical protein